MMLAVNDRGSRTKSSGDRSEIISASGCLQKCSSVQRHADTDGALPLLHNALWKELNATTLYIQAKHNYLCKGNAV
jgi:hypothetical protein